MDITPQQIRDFVMQNAANPAAIAAAMQQYGISIDQIQQAGGWSPEQVNQYVSQAAQQGVQIPIAQKPQFGTSQSGGYDPSNYTTLPQWGGQSGSATSENGSTADWYGDSAYEPAYQMAKELGWQGDPGFDENWALYGGSGEQGYAEDPRTQAYQGAMKWLQDNGYEMRAGPDGGSSTNYRIFKDGQATDHNRSYNQDDNAWFNQALALAGGVTGANLWAQAGALGAGAGGAGAGAAPVDSIGLFGAGAPETSIAAGTGMTNAELAAALGGGEVGAGAGALSTVGGSPVDGQVVNVSGVKDPAFPLNPGTVQPGPMTMPNFSSSITPVTPPGLPDIPFSLNPSTVQPGPVSNGNPAANITPVGGTPSFIDKVSSGAGNWWDRLTSLDPKAWQQGIGALGLLGSLFRGGGGGVSGGGANGAPANKFGEFNDWTAAQKPGVQAFFNRGPQTQAWKPVATGYASGGEVPGALQAVSAPAGYVGGYGSGQADNVEARLSPGEFVMDADVVSALGDGSNEEGARRLEQMRQRVRAHKRSAPASRIPPAAETPEHYLNKKG